VKLPICSLLLLVLASPAKHALTQTTIDLGQKQSHGKVVLVSLSRPAFPPIARTANVSGTVKVLVTVYKDGKTEASVLEGHPLLREAALESAGSSRFECNACDSPAQYALTYSFHRTEKGSCCDGWNAPTEITQEPESTDAQGRRQTEIVISAEHRWLCDPPVTLGPARVRSWRCGYLWRCGGPK